jgi:hypothetical protein
MPARRAINSGNWSSPSTWEAGAVPSSGDDVIITNGVSVTFDITDFTGGALTLEPYALLLFPTTNVERRMTWSGAVNLQPNTVVDVADGDVFGSEFLSISASVLSIDETATWFGSLSQSPRRTNLNSGEWGLTVVFPTPAGATQLILQPATFYTINPLLVPLLTGKTLFIALDDDLVSRTISSATWDDIQRVLTVTLSDPLPAVPSGVSCLLAPDPFSTHVHLILDSVAAPRIDLAAHTVQVSNGPDLTIFGDGLIVINTTAKKVSGRNIWFNDFRSEPSSKITSLQANAVAVCDTTPINYNILATRIGIEGIYAGFSSSPIIVCDFLKIKRNHALSGSTFHISSQTFDGYLNLNGSAFVLVTNQANLLGLSWGPSFNPTSCLIKVGSEQTSSSLADDTFDWFAFLDFLAFQDGAGFDGRIEFRNFGEMKAFVANYRSHEFVIYHDKLRPLKIDIPMTLRQTKVRWGQAKKPYWKQGQEGGTVAWGMLWEKDPRNIEADPPTCEATFTGNVVSLLPGRPDFEVLEKHGDICTITLPSTNSGRFWLFNETVIREAGNFCEPWIYKEEASGYIGFHTPATSATLTQHKIWVATTESAKPVGWRWQATYPNDLAEIRHFVSQYDRNYYAAVFLTYSQKGWQCHAILWKLEPTAEPIRKTMTSPSLTVISPSNIAFGITCHAFIRETTTIRRLTFQMNLFNGWNDYPTPSPIPVTIKYTNFSPQNAFLDLSQDIPRLVFYDGTFEQILILDQIFVEYEKIALKSISEVIRMFAANLKAKLILTGTDTAGNYKSDPTDKFAVTCIVVSGRGKVYFWDWVSGTRDPNNPSHLQQTRLVIEVNETTPTVVSFTPMMFPVGLYIEARKDATAPFLGVYVYSD